MFRFSYLLASEETIQREFGAFAGVRDNFPKYVVTMDELDMSEMESNTAIFVTSCWQRNGTEMFFFHQKICRSSSNARMKKQWCLTQ